MRFNPKLNLTPRFNLRTLFVLTFLCAAFMFSYRVTVSKLKPQRDAVEILEAKNVQFEFEPIKPWVYAKLLSVLVSKEDVRRVVTVKGERRNLKDDDLEQLRKLPYVRNLYLASNPITDAGMEHVEGSMKDLRRVSLWKTEVTDDGIAAFRNKRQLRVFDISKPGTDYSKRATLTNKCLAHFHGHPELRDLRYSFSVDKEGLEHLQSMEKLVPRELKLEKPSAVELKKLRRWKRWLSSLEISGGSFESLEPLTGLRKLRRLKLSGASVRDQQLTGLEQLSTLQTIDLSGTAATDAIGPSLAKLPKLWQLDLRGTSVTCDIYDFVAHKKLLQFQLDAPCDDAAVATMRDAQYFFSREFYLSDRGLAELGRRRRVSGLVVRDAELGEGIPGVTVDAANPYITNEGFQNYIADGLPSMTVESEHLTLAFLAETNGVGVPFQLETKRTPEDVFTVDLPGVVGLVVQGPRLLVRCDGGRRQAIVIANVEKFDLGLLKRFPRLQTLEFDHPSIRELTGEWPVLENLHSLIIDSRRMRLDAKAIRHLSESDDLRTLKVHLQRGLSDEEFAPLAKLSKVYGLELWTSPLSSSQLNAISNLPELRSLRLFQYHDRGEAHGAIQFTGTEHFPKLTKLKSLWLYDVRDDAMPNICAIPNLEHLSISGQLTDKSAPELRRLKRLKYLDARSSGLSEAAILEFARETDIHVRTDGLKAYEKIRLERLKQSQAGE